MILEQEASNWRNDLFEIFPVDGTRCPFAPNRNGRRLDLIGVGALIANIAEAIGLFSSID